MQVLVIALFGAMVVVALWGWVAAPSTARLPVRWGNPPSLDGTVGKGTGLVLWIALGALPLVGSLLADEGTEVMVGLGAGLLAFLLLMEIVTVRRLVR